jgi:hypothetical protein
MDETSVGSVNTTYYRIQTSRGRHPWNQTVRTILSSKLRTALCLVNKWYINITLLHPTVNVLSVE